MRANQRNKEQSRGGTRGRQRARFERTYKCDHEQVREKDLGAAGMSQDNATSQTAAMNAENYGTPAAQAARAPGLRALTTSGD
jgi:hypothetical protein